MHVITFCVLFLKLRLNTSCVSFVLCIVLKKDEVCADFDFSSVSWIFFLLQYSHFKNNALNLEK